MTDIEKEITSLAAEANDAGFFVRCRHGGARLIDAAYQAQHRT